MPQALLQAAVLLDLTVVVDVHGDVVTPVPATPTSDLSRTGVDALALLALALLLVAAGTHLLLRRARPVRAGARRHDADTSDHLGPRRRP